jgi:copper chaperone CopZ
MVTSIKNSSAFITGLTTAIAASLCCITPLLAVLGGATSMISSFSWIEPFRPYLVGLTILVFAFAWYQKLRPRKQVDCGCEVPNKPSFLQSKTLLSLVTALAVAMICFPYYAKAFYKKSQEAQAITSKTGGYKQVVFTIKGMTCEGCTEHVNSKIATVQGVINYQTSYEKAISMVKFDGNKTSIDSIAAAINLTGYKVVTQTTVKN